ncbi:MAG: UDP-2,3-diacylglucosamine pyrophosphatase [Micavibrio sp.]|nr:UDP-2,3-diacylglucosamine pyrophosphatase [Micavibrio sp.]|tara:strand:- start:370668 stop:371546 length:879 start_codon:yes stop_codon:yes gene_type:complete
MSAKEKSIKSIKKLGILAGGGDLPRMLVDACLAQNIEPYILAFEDEAEDALVEGIAHNWTRMGAAAKNIKLLKHNNIEHVVFCGSVTRPSLKSLRPDWRAIKFFTKVGLKSLGDNSLLTSVRDELEKEGFCFHGAQEFMDSLLTPEGVLGQVKPTEAHMNDIVQGYHLSHAIGKLDIGQSIIMQEGVVLGVEAVEGTDALIKRVADYKKEGATAPILVKTCKPQQDRNLDLPTIGIDTIQNAIDAKMAGIALQADESFFLHRNKAIALANKHNLFVIGVTDKAIAELQKEEG